MIYYMYGNIGKKLTPKQTPKVLLAKYISYIKTKKIIIVKDKILKQK